MLLLYKRILYFNFRSYFMDAFNDGSQLFSFVDILMILFHSCLGIEKRTCFFS